MSSNTKPDKPIVLGGSPTTKVIKKEELADGGPGTSFALEPARAVQKVGVQKDADGNLTLTFYHWE